MIWKTLLVAESSGDSIDHPELLAEVAEGVVYVDEVRAKRAEAEAAA